MNRQAIRMPARGTNRARWKRGKRGVSALLGLAGALGVALSGGPAAAQAGALTNAIVLENQKPGNGPAEWSVRGQSDPDLVGFATRMSVNLGETMAFKVRSLAPSYRLDIYRLGYYGGRGARRVATLTPATPSQTQPECAKQPIDCGAWAVSATWAVPAGAVSGVYVAKLVRTDGVRSNGSHIVFVVRDDGGRSALLFQTSDTTWQAYNRYGGTNSNLYNGALRVSYNRPLLPSEGDSETIFGPEYSLLRFLEHNGFDVSYTSGVDTAARGGLILRHKVFLSVGHDEYWSAEQRASVEAARDAGVHLAFLSGNEIFWKTRWEADFRTMVCYKETTFGRPHDPQGFTGTWRDARFRTAGDPARPENALSGTLFRVNRTHPRTLMVPEADGKLRFWRNTAAASQALCQVAALGASTLGHEWNEDEDNGFRPPGLMRLSSTTVNHAPVLSGPGTAAAGSFYNELSGFSTHHATLYRHPSGALVFSAGTIDWAFGLDSGRRAGNGTPAHPGSPAMQQATVNLLADMGAQPASLAADLAPAQPSGDHAPPSSRITYPAAGDTLRAGSLVTITGTASDAEGRVGGVEVSVDGGGTWHPAVGRESFHFDWMTGPVGPAVLMSRAVDDSGNVETPGPGVPVELHCKGPCTLWRDDAAPAQPWVQETQAVEVGVRFRADAGGTVSGVRFYKDERNRGPHRVSLWSEQGQLLASAAATGESARGWQSVTFPHPVAIAAGATYVASYGTASGHAQDAGFFAGKGHYRLPLRALAHGGVSGPRGVFPASGAGAADANFWVDVLFNPERSAPRGFFGVNDHPEVQWRMDPQPTEVGVRFRLEADGYVAGIRFWKGAGNSGPHVVNLWAPTPEATPVPAAGGGRLLASATALGERPSGWQTVTFDAPVAVTAGGEYVASYHTTTGYAQDLYYFANHEVYDPPLRAIDSVYRVGQSAYPKLNAFSSNYWVEPVFVPAAAFAFHLWPGETVPAPRQVSDATPIEMGIRFKPELDGFIAGIRFWKQSATNDRPHTGSLWTADGRELATAAFAGETPCGWQEVRFAAPVPVTAGTTYVASYHSESGYVIDQGYLARLPTEWRGVWNPPLRVPPDGDLGVGLNGVYRTGPHAFPDTGFQSSNYWIDVVFRTAPDP